MLSLPATQIWGGGELLNPSELLLTDHTNALTRIATASLRLLEKMKSIPRYKVLGFCCAGEAL